MKKFNVKFQREFEVQIEADNGEHAKQITHQILTGFPKDSCKLLSIVAEGHEEAECAGCAVDPMHPHGKPRGNPDGGGSSGGTIARVPVLVDQIAEAA